MKAHRMPEMKEGGVNVTPLIDIVMCLIIFFMLVAKIGVDTGSDAKIQIPPSILGMKIEDMGNTLTLNVDSPPVTSDLNTAEPLVTALLPGKGGREELQLADKSTGRRPLLEALKFLRFGSSMKPGPKPGENGDNPEFKVIIHGSENMEYRFLEQVLVTCAEAQVKNVNFETRTVTEIVQ